MGDVFVPVYGHQLTDRLRIGEDGRGFFSNPSQQSAQGASLSRPAPKYYTPQQEAITYLGGRDPDGPDEPAESKAPKPKPKPAPHKDTPDELMRKANALEGQMRTEHDARMAAGPAVLPTQKRDRDEWDDIHDRLQAKWSADEQQVPGAPPRWIEDYMQGQRVSSLAERTDPGLIASQGALTDADAQAAMAHLRGAR
jgi:hypothetical protein